MVAGVTMMTPHVILSGSLRTSHVREILSSFRLPVLFTWLRGQATQNYFSAHDRAQSSSPSSNVHRSTVRRCTITKTCGTDFDGRDLGLSSAVSSGPLAGSPLESWGDALTAPSCYLKQRQSRATDKAMRGDETITRSP